MDEVYWNKSKKMMNGPIDLTKLFCYLETLPLRKRISFKEGENNSHIEYTSYFDRVKELKVISIENSPQNYYAYISMYKEISKKVADKVDKLTNIISKEMEMNYPSWRSSENWVGKKFNHLKAIKN